MLIPDYVSAAPTGGGGRPPSDRPYAKLRFRKITNGPEPLEAGGILGKRFTDCV